VLAADVRTLDRLGEKSGVSVMAGACGRERTRTDRRGELHDDHIVAVSDP